MPAEQAWKDISAKAVAGRTANALPIPGQIDWEVILGDAQKQAEEAAAEATVPSKALEDIIQQVSQYLVVELPKKQQIKDSDWRLSLGVGKFEDRTADNRLSSAADQITNQLMTNQSFNNHFSVLASDEKDAEAVLRQLASSDPDATIDPLSTENTGPRQVYADDLYVLTGWADVATDNRNRELTTTTYIRVWHPRSRENVLSRVFKRTYYFHPGSAYMQFISEDENEQLRARWEAK